MDTYEKKYNEILAWAKKYKARLNGVPIEEIFPELAESESEDERKRKKLYNTVMETPNDSTWFDGTSKEAMLAWLEKQKEQKPVEIHIDNPNIQKVDPDIKIETRTDGTGDLDGKALLYTADKSYKIGFRDGVASVKPVEWGEEDEKMRKLIIAVLQVNHPNGFFKANDLGDSNMRGVPVEELVAWLKSLRPTKDCNGCSKHLQGYIDGRGDAENKLLEMYGILLMPDGELRMKPQWKPSEEQIEAVRYFVNRHQSEAWAATGQWKQFTALRGLLGILQKLR